MCWIPVACCWGFKLDREGVGANTWHERESTFAVPANGRVSGVWVCCVSKWQSYWCLGLLCQQMAELVMSGSAVSANGRVSDVWVCCVSKWQS